MSENLPRVKQELYVRLPSMLGEVNLQELRYSAAEDLIIIGSTVIRRRSNGLFCLNDIHDALAKQDDNRAPNRFLRLRSVIDDISRLEAIYGPGVLETILYGDDRGTYAHEEIAQDYAAWLNPEYKALLRAVARKASVLQAAALKEKLERVEAEYGEEVAKRIETEKQLASLDLDLTFAYKIVEDERQKARAANRAIALQNNPMASKRKDSAEYKAERAVNELKYTLNEISQCIEVLALADNCFERVRIGLAKEQSKLYAELKTGRERLSSVIDRLIQAIQ